MRLSNIIPKMAQNLSYQIINEQDFVYLGLSASKVDIDLCVFIDSEKYIEQLGQNVKMVITNSSISANINTNRFGVCVVENPRVLFFDIHNYLSNNNEYKRLEFSTTIGKNCKISPLAVISPNNVLIGDNVTIEEFVVIRENTKIGDNSTIRSGVVIGGEGYEFKRVGDIISSVKHLGGVLIGEHVEIQYNSCIDKAVYPWDNTIIGDYNKIDNLVHIAHAVKTEKNVMIVAQSGIGGRTVIKQDTWIGFASTITNGIEIGKNARANIGSVVTKSINENQSYSGNFAIEHSKFLRFIKKISSEEIL
jgi:UDP-3-O-[3-hydroxymyristoyl] glucosamine N-acyltransferase